MQRSAIVIGATGLIGSHLVDLLCQSEDFSQVQLITRRAVALESSKLTNLVVDFDELAGVAKSIDGDVLFSCLGTTLKQAGSIEAQRKVDYHYQLNAAEIALKQGASQLVLVSSSGANSKSRSPYLRMKGELEAAVENLGFTSVSIVQPSLLLGDRSMQPGVRFAETIGAAVLPLICKLPGLSQYRPIPAQAVAKRMIQLALQNQGGVQRVSLEAVFPD